MAGKSPKRKPRLKKNSSPAWSLPDPRSPSQILAEEALLTKPMLAKVLGYKSVRSVDFIVAEDCASEDPALRPIYLRRPRVRRGAWRPKDFPSFKSLRFRREDVFAYIEKMQIDFPADLEWKFGGRRNKQGGVV
ncbi:hypothetical protein ACFLQ0_03345 [Nitrospinota bacterium]